MCMSHLKCFFWLIEINSSFLHLAQICVSSNVTKVVNPTKSFPILFISPAKLSMTKISSDVSSQPQEKWRKKGIVFSQFPYLWLGFVESNFLFLFLNLKNLSPETCSWCFCNQENDWTFQSEFHRMLVSSQNIFQSWKCCNHASYFSTIYIIRQYIEKRKEKGRHWVFPRRHFGTPLADFPAVFISYL